MESETISAEERKERFKSFKGTMTGALGDNYADSCLVLEKDLIAGITSCFVLVRRARQTRVDHVGALNRFCRALSLIDAYSISIIRGEDRPGRTRVSRGRAEA
jgi:hypothetical protein